MPLNVKNNVSRRYYQTLNGRTAIARIAEDSTTAVKVDIS